MTRLQVFLLGCLVLSLLVPVAFSLDGRRAAYAARRPQGDDVVSCLPKDSPVGRVC